MKFKVEYAKQSVTNIGDDNPLFIDYYLTIDKDPEINVDFRGRNVCISAAMFTIRCYHRIEGERRKVFQHFKLSSRDGNLTYNELERIFVDNYVTPNMKELTEAIDKAINKFIINESL